MKNNTKGDLLISVVFMVAAGILSITRLMNGKTTDGILWMLAAVAVLIKEIRRYIYNQKK